MKGIEHEYLRECIRALCEARVKLLALPCKNAVSEGEYGKSDSLALDDVPEITICDMLTEFDPDLPLVTEEIGLSEKLRDTDDEFVCFLDPMDRSKVLANFLERFFEETIATVFQNERMIKEWEAECGGDVEVSGPYASITAIHHHSILFNVMINYITGIIYIASDEGIGTLSADQIFEEREQKRVLKRSIDLNNMLKPILFAERSEFSRFGSESVVTFCQNEQYKHNLVATKIFGNETIEEIQRKHLLYDRPGGPARILYLKEPPHAGFILSNGEKIGEWIGWLAYVKYSEAKLRAYEIAFESSWTRDQILMAPGPAYSILGDHIGEVRGRLHKTVKLSMAKLGYLDNPSRYRSTILVCPASNRDIITRLSISKYTELTFAS